MQELGQSLLRVRSDVCRHLVGGRSDGLQRILETFALALRGLQFLQQGIDGGSRHFGRFAQCDKGVGKRGGFVGGKSELFRRTADTRHRGDNVFFTRGGIVAQDIDGVAEFFHFADWELEHVGNRCGGIACFLSRQAECGCHSRSNACKFIQLIGSNT